MTLMQKRAGRCHQESRPVSHIAGVGKVMESFLRDQFVKRMMDRNYVCDTQHGFLAGHPCMTQLLFTLELWTKWLDKGEPLEVTYVDFQERF